MRHVAGDQAAHDAAEEACAHEDGGGAGNEARGNARPVRDGVGDIAGQCGHEEAEGQGANLEEHGTQVRPQRTPGQFRIFGGQVEEAVLREDLVSEGRDVVAAQEEAEGDQETAASHERDHVADTGQEGLLQLRANVLALFLGLQLGLFLSAEVGHAAGMRVVRGGEGLLRPSCPARRCRA